MLLFEHSEVFIRCTRSRKTGCRAFKHYFDRYIGNFMAFVCHITVTMSLKKLREVFKRVHDLLNQFRKRLRWVYVNLKTKKE